jgi:hypothetical protein
LAAAENFRDFYETPQNAVKTNRAKQPRERKKTKKEKSRIFGDEPDGFVCLEKQLSCFF